MFYFHFIALKNNENKKMKKTMILLLKIILGAAILFGLYVIGAILYAQITDYKPKPVEAAEVLPPKEELPLIDKDTLVFYDWNIGYCGLGKESDFFYDGGKMVRPSEALSEKNLNGVLSTLGKWKSDADFIYKIEIVLEEADESHYWLEVVREAKLITGKELDRLIDEANQLTAIFAATDKTSKENKRNK